MAEDNEDREEGTELDVTPQGDKGEAPGGDGKDKGDAAEIADRGTSSDKSDRASRPTGNRWRAIQSRVGETLKKGIKGAESDHQISDEDLDDEEREDAEGDEDLEGREDESDRDDDEDLDREDSERKGEKGKAGAADDDSDLEDEADTRYEVVDEGGDKFKIELPKGAVIRFQADGEAVELKSVNELVANAQKGLAFDRVTSRAGQENAALRKVIREFEEAQKEDSDLLLKLVYEELEEEELEKLKEELQAYRDPKAREGLQALAEKEDRVKRENAESVRGQQEAVKTFWKATGVQVKADLPRFEYLDAEDEREIQDRFYDVYTAELDRLTPEYKRQAAEQGLEEAEALFAADRDARKFLTEKNLRKVMRDLDDKYQRRAGRGRDGKAENRGKREADDHNRRVEAKRLQRRDPAHRSLRSGGAAPRDRSDLNRSGNEPVGFDAKIQRGLARLRQAGREAAGSGAEE